jgi:hypothetical protein
MKHNTQRRLASMAVAAALALGGVILAKGHGVGSGVPVGS